MTNTPASEMTYTVLGGALNSAQSSPMTNTPQEQQDSVC